jgi:hypothetical protein
VLLAVHVVDVEMFAVTLISAADAVPARARPRARAPKFGRIVIGKASRGRD